MDCSLLGSSVHGILQVSCALLQGSSQLRDKLASLTSLALTGRFFTTSATWVAPFSSVQPLSWVRLFVTPWITEHQASLSITNSRSSLKLMSFKSVMPSSHLILCHPLLFLPTIPPSIRVFFNESTLRMRWPLDISSPKFRFKAYQISILQVRECESLHGSVWHRSNYPGN